ncbi:hypothetical protein [Halobaculum sp. D14]|uniref:hypothetical protein n=1 Tax=Halobaculum sp. D14 TaxID=3421642 RepID=UPI003EBB30DB
MSRCYGRRAVLRGVGAAAAGAVGGGLVVGTAAASHGGDDADAEEGLFAVHELSATDAALTDAARSDGDAYLVASDGTVLRHTDRWETVTADGPTGNSHTLTAAATTQFDEDVWVGGDGGALAEYDPEDGSFTDHSATAGIDSSVTDVAAVEADDTKRVYVADESGVVTVGVGGEDEPPAAWTWNQFTPGSGSTIPDFDTYCRHGMHVVDTNGAAFEACGCPAHRGKGGLSWSRIGVDDADVNYFGVASHGPVLRHENCGMARRPGGATVVGGNGTVLTGDANGWRRFSVGDATLRDVVAYKHDQVFGVALGDAGTAAQFVLPPRGSTAAPQVHRFDLPVEETLHGLTHDDEFGVVIPADDGAVVTTTVDVPQKAVSVLD